MLLDVEQNFDHKIVNELINLGHVVRTTPSVSGFAALTAIGRENGRYQASFDPRRGGSISVYPEN